VSVLVDSITGDLLTDTGGQLSPSLDLRASHKTSVTPGKEGFPTS
jgi:hypothetical protein